MKIKSARELFLMWLTLSVIWVGAVAFQTWREIPRDDWVQSEANEPNGDQYDVPAGIFHPIVRVIVARAAWLAFIPPIGVLGCGLACLLTFRSLRRRK